MPRLVVPKRSLGLLAKAAPPGGGLTKVAPAAPGTPSPGTPSPVVPSLVVPSPGDDYQDRLVKYIPAESVALYAFTDKLLTSYYGIDAAGRTALPPDAVLAWLPWALFLLGLLGTPAYLWRQRVPGHPWALHAIIGTVAFLLWAYTLGGSLFVLHGWYNVLIAGLAAPIFTFAAGLFEPR